MFESQSSESCTLTAASVSLTRPPVMHTDYSVRRMPQILAWSKGALCWLGGNLVMNHLNSATSQQALSVYPYYSKYLPNR